MNGLPDEINNELNKSLDKKIPEENPITAIVEVKREPSPIVDLSSKPAEKVEYKGVQPFFYPMLACINNYLIAGTGAAIFSEYFKNAVPISFWPVVAAMGGQTLLLCLLGYIASRKQRLYNLMNRG